MPEPITCTLVTPSAELLSERVDYANVPAHDGLIGFQHGSSPLVAKLGLGKLTLRFPADLGSGTREYFIDGGFLKMAHNELIILADKAFPAEQISETDAKAELAEAEARVINPEDEDKFGAAERIRKERAAARLKLSMAQHSKAAGI